MHRPFYYTTLIVLGVLVFGLSSCEPEFDKPQGLQIPFGDTLFYNDTIYTGFLDISVLKAIQADSGDYKFKDNFNIYATVSADEVSGNFFRNVYIQDESGAINMRMLSTGGLYEGDRIRVNLNGAIVSNFNGMLQLDSVDVDRNVVIQSNNNPVEVIDADITSILTDPLGFQSKLVQIDDVEFVQSELGLSFAISNSGNSESPQSVNRNIQDCQGNSIIVRNSGFASFADDILPRGSGSITAIVGQFGDDIQLYIRDTEDLAFGEFRCDGSTGFLVYEEDFDSYPDASSLDLTENWSTWQQVNPNVDWVVKQFFEKITASVTSWNGSSGEEAITWLISKPIDLSEAQVAIMAFDNMKRFDGPTLETLISTDHVQGQDPTLATWELVEVQYDTNEGSWDLVPSDAVDISQFIGETITVAFRYTGTTSGSPTWELDNISIRR